MESFINEPKEKPKTSYNILIGAILVAVLFVAGFILLLYMRPSEKSIQQKALETSLKPGSPEFEALTRKIVISTDENRLMQSPTALGTIMMSIGGNLKNLTGKTLTLVEVNVAVVDMKGNVLKDENVLVIPRQSETLADREEVPITATIEGFKKEDERANFRWKVTAIKAE
jgi:hypothetical protein